MLGGVDSGLRMGGRCKHKLHPDRFGTVLGVLKKQSSSVKVQWDINESAVG